MPKKIFLIEQSAELAGKIDDFLTEMGYAITVCGDDEQALHFARELGPDLVISNEGLGSRSGHEVLKRFKTSPELSKIPFLMLATKKPTRKDKGRILADTYVRLPLDSTRLYIAVCKWLESDKPPRLRSAQESGDSRWSKAQKKRKGKRKKEDIDPDLQGKISSDSLARAFYRLLDTDATGYLRFKTERKKLKAFIKNGKIVDVGSNYIRQDSLGRHLMREGKITEKENDACLQRAQDRSVKQGEFLVNLGILSRRDMEIAVRRQKTQKLISLFSPSWFDGDFSFRSEEIDDRDDIPVNYPIREFLALAVFSHTPPKQAYQSFLANGMVGKDIFFQPEFEQVAAKLGLTKNQLSLIPMIEGKSLRDLKIYSRDRFKDMVLLCFLLDAAKALSFGVKPKIPEKPVQAPEPSPPPQAPGPSPAPTLSKPQGAAPPASRTPVEAGKPVAPVLNDEFFEHYEAGRLLFEDEKFQEAEPLLKKAHGINSQSSDVLCMLAWINYMTSGKNNQNSRDEAREMLRSALQLDDLNDMAHYLIAMILKDEDHIKLAATHFKTAYRLNPQNEDAKREMGLLDIKLRSQKDKGIHF